MSKKILISRIFASGIAYKSLKIFLFSAQLVQSGEDIVTYTTACSDLVAPLDMFKANCMPTFLVLAAGDIVAFVHGANGKRMKEVVE